MLSGPMINNAAAPPLLVIERRSARSTSDSPTSARNGTVGRAERRDVQKGHDVEQSLVVFDHHQTLAADDDMLPAANKNSSAAAQLDRERNKRRRANKLSQFLKHVRIIAFWNRPGNHECQSPVLAPSESLGLVELIPGSSVGSHRVAGRDAALRRPPPPPWAPNVRKSVR